MSINMEVLVETIKERKKDMIGKRALTNELAIDDLMILLGYNMKRDTSVLRLYDNLDWKVVYPTGSRLAVRTFALTDQINEEEAEGAFISAAEDDTAVLMLTNGEDIHIYGINPLERKYTLICEYNIYDTMDENIEKVFKAITKNGFDRSRIESFVMEKYVTDDKVKEWLNKYKDQIIKFIAEHEKLSDYNKFDPIYSALINSEHTAEVNTSTEDIDALKESITQLESEKESLSGELESIKTEKESLSGELESIKTEKESLSGELESTKAEKESLLEDKNKLTEQLSNNQAELEDLKNKITELEEKPGKDDSEALENAMSQISNLTLQNNSLVNQIDKLNEQLEEKDNEIERLKGEIENLNNTVEELNAEVAKLNSASLDDYIQQIHDLTEQYNCVAEEKDILLKKVKQLQEEINDLEGIDKKKAQELLDVIQVGDDKPRQYVGVINTELFQYNELNKFVGCVLQKLSELKGHLAASYIFDGDMFSIVPNGERKDLMINNKYFDVELNDMGEEEAINKLRIIFSHFDDLIFDCKLVGHLEVSDDIEYTLDKDINRDVNADLESEAKTGFKVSLFKPDKNDENNVDTEEEQVEEQFDNSYTENEYIEPTNQLMVVQLQSYFDMFMLDAGESVMNYTGIKYIGTNNITFKLNETEELDRQLIRCVDALLAIESGRGRTSIIKDFKKFDLREISEVIFKYDSTTKDFPKFTASKYCVNGVKDVLDLVKILYDICEQMKIDMSDIFIYANAYTNAVDITDVYGYNEDNVIIYDNLQCNVDSDGTEVAAIVKGDIFNNIIFTHNSLNIHSQLIKKAVGVKTKYMSQTIASYDDFLNTIKLLVTNALNNGIEDNIICRCTTLDGRHKLISTDTSEVSEEYKEIQANDRVYYVSKVDNWEIAESLLRIHTDVYNDTAIAIKVMLRNNILNFVNTEFYTSEPSLALAVYSFRNYINSVIK